MSSLTSITTLLVNCSNSIPRQVLLQQHNLHQPLLHLQQEEICRCFMTVYCSNILHHSRISQFTNTDIFISHRVMSAGTVYRVSQEERTKLREGVPYVKLYRYNPKHLYPKLNGYGDNGQRKVWTSWISAYCTSAAV